jgi:methionine-rich copper-binding protein CopC
MRRRAALAALPLALLATIPVARAHALLQKTEPGRRATLRAAPVAIRLWFNERLEPAFSEVAVTGPDGRPVTSERAALAPDNPKLLVLPLPPLGPGEYTVAYKVLSVDGHTVQSGYRFTVKGDAAPK